MTEQQLQAKCFLWFWNNHPEERRMLFHVDNNSSNSVVGNQKKALGVTKGVSDLIYILPWGKTVFLECKLPGGVQKPEQREFMVAIQQREHLYFIFRSLEEFQAIIKNLWET
jgi:hypothetical protein